MKFFFNFVDEHTEDIEGVMGATWFNDIFEHTQLWTVSDAERFLNLLVESEYPTPHILTILRNTQSLQRIQKQVTNLQFQTGSDVFIEYVRNHLRGKLQQSQPHLEGEALEKALEDLMLRQMSSRRNAPLWEERISKDAEGWSIADAILFLDDLENNWGMDIDVIIKRLNATSFFQIATYTSFILRLEVYTEYLGKGSVQNILARTFMPFRGGEVEEIRALLDAVFAYFDFEKGIMIEILSKNLHAISQNTLELFNRRLSWLESFLGRGDRTRGKEEIKIIVREKKSLNIIDSVHIKFNKATGEYENETEFLVDFLRNRGIYDQEELIDLFKSNPRAFSMGDLSTEKITYLEQSLEVEESVEIEGQKQVERRDGKAELDWVMRNRSFAGIVNFKIYKNKEGLFENKYVSFLQERGLTPLQIADVFKSNPLVFSMGDLSTEKITYLEQLLEVEESVEIEGQMQVERRDGKAELDWVIENKSFAGIVDFKIYKNKEALPENKYVKFLQERGLEAWQIADVFKNNPRAFSIGDLSADKISYLEEYLGKGDRNKGKKKLDQIILKKGRF